MDLTQAEEHYQAGLRLHTEGKDAAAVEALRNAMALGLTKPEVLSTYGNVLVALGEVSSALEYLGHAVALEPRNYRLWSNFGLALLRLGDEQALSALGRAVMLAPNDVEVRHNLGTAALQLGDPETALEELTAALQLAPDHLRARLNLGSALRALNRYEEAVTEAKACIAARADWPEAHWNLALAMLSLGQPEGWQEYEWRTRIPGFSMPHVELPRWIGGPLPGRLLVYAEQGLGDTIQFARYIQYLKQDVVFGCPPKLVRLMRGLSGSTVVELGYREGCSAAVPLLSLPGLLGVTPKSEPYLRAEPETRERFRTRLAALPPGPRIALCWRGGKRYEAPGRDILLSVFAPLCGAGAQLVSVQLGGSQEIRDSGLPITTFEDLDQGPDAFVDTAAILSVVDAVVSVDTAVAHLAGALGIPLWLLLPWSADWRWGRDTIPAWSDYARMRVLRQKQPGDWDSVIAALAEKWAEKWGHSTFQSALVAIRDRR